MEKAELKKLLRLLQKYIVEEEKLEINPSILETARIINDKIKEK